MRTYKQIISDLQKFEYEKSIKEYENIDIEFQGIEPEREDLVNLKSLVDYWNTQISVLSLGNGWQFPDVWQKYYESQLVVHEWDEWIAGTTIYSSSVTEWQVECERLSHKESRISQPDPIFVQDVFYVIRNLHVLWAVLSVRYAKAVARKHDDLATRLKLCTGIVHITATQ